MVPKDNKAKAADTAAGSVSEDEESKSKKKREDPKNPDRRMEEEAKKGQFDPKINDYVTNKNGDGQFENDFGSKLSFPAKHTDWLEIRTGDKPWSITIRIPPFIREKWHQRGVQHAYQKNLQKRLDEIFDADSNPDVKVDVKPTYDKNGHNDSMKVTLHGHPAPTADQHNQMKVAVGSPQKSPPAQNNAFGMKQSN